MLDLYLDADGCPVREESFKVAERYQMRVFLVANKHLQVPASERIKMVVVSGGFDAADDWIAEQAGPGDIVVTADILLAERCLKNQTRVLGPKGEEFTEDNIGSAIASRELMKNLRAFGEVRGGPAPMQKNNRSQFLGKLDQIIQNIKRHPPQTPQAKVKT